MKQIIIEKKVNLIRLVAYFCLLVGSIKLVDKFENLTKKKKDSIMQDTEKEQETKTRQECI